MIDQTNNDLVLTGALAFALSQILLSLILLLRRRRCWSVQEQLYTAFLLAVSGYLLLPLATSPAWQLALATLQTFVPGLFWLLSASLFDDHFRLRTWKLGLVAITVLMPLAGSVIRLQSGQSNQMLFFTLPQALEFVLMSLALIAVVRTWRTDLVQSRRTLRLWFSGLGGAYIMILLLVREVLFSGAEWLPVWQYVPVGMVMLAANGILLQYRSGTFLPEIAKITTAPPLPGDIALQGGPPAVTAASDRPASLAESELSGEAKAVQEVPEEILEALNRLMQADCVYREMGLTIGQLAARMEMPEYRLRKVINTGLGYRNFNDFLNTYRIREARRRLSCAEETHTPVLNIALDAGYRSLSSFNKAFKATLGQTPTEFRNSNQAK